MCNTGCPVQDRMSEFDELKDEDVLRVYSNMYFRSLPCPSILFMAIRKITNLRMVAAAAAAMATSADLCPIFDALARRIFLFEPDTWTEAYRIPTRPEIPIFARIFKSATLLYGLISLPDHLSQSFHISKRAGRQDSLIYYREELMKALQEASAIPSALYGLCWPTAVLGVAVHNGTAEQQAAVLDILEQIKVGFMPGAGPATLLERLPEFWTEDRNGWEDCFYKPFQVMS